MARRSSLELRDALEKALLAHRTGNVAEAERLYRSILEQEPDHPHALHYLGVAHAQRGGYEEACRLIEQSLGRHRSAPAYSHLGNALKGLSRLDEALASYDTAISLDPTYVEAPYNRGNALRELGRFDEALASYDQAIAIKPGYTPAHFARAALFKELERFEDALGSFDRATAIEPDRADAWNGRGNALMALGRPDEALASYDRAVAVSPDYAEAYSNRGNALLDLGRFDDALASYARATAIRPDYAEAHYNTGKALTEMGHLDAAVASYEWAIAVRPHYAEAHTNRGSVLVRLRRIDEALTSYADALTINPEYAEAHWNEGICRLLLGDFPRGWEQYEWRWGIKNARPKRYTTYAVWPGQRVTGRLLGWSEQGLGDNIFFAGMVGDLSRMADHLVLQVDPRLVTLFQRSFPAVEVIDHEQVVRAEPIDWTIPMGSTGRYLRRSLSDFAGSAAYLQPDPARRDALRRRLDDGSFRVGISWITKNRESGVKRTIPLARWERLLTLPGVRYVDLQYGETLEERESVTRRWNVTIAHLEDVDNYADIDGLAALITACDLVVTIDNTTAHLAAALGTPTWILLPFVPDWRWLLDREDSPWYPSVRLFRQPRLDDWESVMERVLQALGARSAH
ncbi:MAG: tetratricopeptide repeat protein [Candidatus Rokuibacteriota bacterium]